MESVRPWPRSGARASEASTSGPTRPRPSRRPHIPIPRSSASRFDVAFVEDLDEVQMNSLNVDRYPCVASNPEARALSELEASLGHAPNTIDAYARGREDFLRWCSDRSVSPERASREHVALWVRDLLSRPTSSVSLASREGLANATVQQRLTAVRLFFDHLIEMGCRIDNPVGRGRYTPGKSFAGYRDRGLVARYCKLPWIPSDEEWQTLLTSIQLEPLRNRTMFALSYDAALRREELCRLEIDDFDFSHRLLTVRAETSKSRRTRVVPFSETSATLISAYLRHRRLLCIERGLIFLSESTRNSGSPLTIWTWSKVASRVAKTSGVVRFSTHALRHLCLTDLARSGWDIHEIALFAGHQSIETTKHYIHLSGVELAAKLRAGMAELHAWRLASLDDRR